MITLKLKENKLGVFKNDEYIFTPCHNGLLDFLTKNGLDVFSRVTEKRATKLLIDFGQPEYANKIQLDSDQLAAVDNNMILINKLVKTRGLMNIVSNVYLALKDRDINPSGSFDKGGRFYADNSELISCRSPSRSWPYPEMTACRALKYVKKCAIYFNCESETQLLACV